MRRFFFLLPALALALAPAVACNDENVVVIKADSGASDGGAEPRDSGKIDQPPIGTQTDSGVSGRRLGDKGCKVNEDCDSSNCFIGATDSDNFCTKSCTKATAATDCPAPLPGTCSRQLICDPPQ